jgi:GxxExxY protein
MTEFLHKELSQKTIGAFYAVYKTLGYGFLEKVYENALAYELTLLKIEYKVQSPIEVYYKSQKVGFYIADMIIENNIILELKAAESLCQEHEYQLINYLKATNIEVGILLNFGKEPQFKRVIFTNNRKFL